MQTTPICCGHSDAPIKSTEDLRRPGGPRLVLASTAQGSGSNDIAVLLRDALHLNLRIVNGYTDNAAECIAVDRREADALLMGLTATNALRPQWLRPNGGMRPLLQFARSTRYPLFPKTPTADELASDRKTKVLLAFAEVSFKLAWPVAAPPGVPSDRAKALEDAFLAVQHDPGYVAEAKRMNFDISPIDGHEISLLISQLYGSPVEALDYMRRLRTPGKNN
jgi:tripartite-type tricarboxylate transporter receptor subunit TctC